MNYRWISTEPRLLETPASLIPQCLNVNLGLLSLASKIMPGKTDNGRPQLPWASIFLFHTSPIAIPDPVMRCRERSRSVRFSLSSST